MSVYKYRFHKKIYFYFRVSLNGKQFSRRFINKKRFHTFEEAQIAESNFLIQYKKNHKDDIFVLSVLDEYKEYLEGRYKTTTQRSYILCFKNYFFELLRFKKLNEINSDFVSSIVEFISKNDKGNKELMFKTLKTFIIFLSKYGIYIQMDYLIKNYSSRNMAIKESRFWSLEEFKKFYSVIDEDYWRLLFLVLYYYGLRIGELRGIKQCNFIKDKLIIDCQITNKGNSKGQIELSPKTSSSNRLFPMFPFIYEVYERLKDLWFIKESKLLFPSKKNPLLAIGETTINRMLDKYCKLSNVNRINLHGFRHSCASLLINSGMDALQVSSWLGHSSPAITLKVYSHLFDSKKNEIFSFLENTQSKLK